MSSARAFWRWLTSMRTALLLLLLLAVAAVPGSVFPQRNVSIESVNAYLRINPELGRWVDRLWGFDVYASPWFSAIYLLLFASLVGCLVPRLRLHLRNIVARPPDAPARLERLPHFAAAEPTTAPRPRRPSAVRDVLRGQRWRTVLREQADGTVTVAAEKGYLKETGNLVFHFALLALLIGVALGSWYGWHGNILVVADDEAGFCNTVQQYDEYGLGARTTRGRPAAVLRAAGRLLAPSTSTTASRCSTRPTSPTRRGCPATSSPTGCGSTTRCGWTGRTSTCSATATRRCCGSPTARARSARSRGSFLPDDTMLTSSGVARYPDHTVAPGRPYHHRHRAGRRLPAHRAGRPVGGPVGLPGRA